jgi:hypothetical protein
MNRINSFLLVLIILCLNIQSSFGQKSKSVWTVDFVKVKNNQLDSAVLVLQKNWGAARKYAKKMKFVKSYQLLIANQGIKANAEFDILLVTEYADKEKYENREKNFSIVFDKFLPDWVYVNGKKPKDYTEIKFDMVFEGELPLTIQTQLLQTVKTQEKKKFVPEGDANYFDFLEGNWYKIRNDSTIDKEDYKKIKRSVNASSFIEEWHFSNGQTSIALRAWDKTNKKWTFTWTNDEALFQVWENKKIDSVWYIYRQFDTNGEKYTARQSFILQSDGTMIWQGERSTDDKTWTVRWKDRFKKVND